MKTGSSSARAGAGKASSSMARAAAPATKFLRRSLGLIFMLMPASVAVNCGDTEEISGEMKRRPLCYSLLPTPWGEGAPEGRMRGASSSPSPPPGLWRTGGHCCLLRRVPPLGPVGLRLGRHRDLVDRTFPDRELLGRR